VIFRRSLTLVHMNRSTPVGQVDSFAKGGSKDACTLAAPVKLAAAAELSMGVSQ